MKKDKQDISVGDKIAFHSGNFDGLTGIVIKTNHNSTDKRALFGYLHTVKLSNNQIGYIEKSEHWHFI